MENANACGKYLLDIRVDCFLYEFMFRLIYNNEFCTDCFGSRVVTCTGAKQIENDNFVLFFGSFSLFPSFCGVYEYYLSVCWA